MSMTDPIADMLTRIRNAIIARHETVDIPGSRLKRAIARVLKEEGYVSNFKYLKDNKQGIIKIFLKYDSNNQSVISGIDRISTPGMRTYSGASEMPRVKRGLGISIISTSKGVMTDKNARKQNVGGEVLCRVW